MHSIAHQLYRDKIMNFVIICKLGVMEVFHKAYVYHFDKTKKFRVCVCVCVCLCVCMQYMYVVLPNHSEISIIRIMIIGISGLAQALMNVLFQVMGYTCVWLFRTYG